jgi:hypothetical protein
VKCAQHLLCAGYNILAGSAMAALAFGANEFSNRRSIMTVLARCLLSIVLMLFNAAGFAQAERASCAMLKSLDLKPLLGADHDAPVPFGQESCRVESKSPGKMVALAVSELPPDVTKNWVSTRKKMDITYRAKEATIVAEPSLGPEAYSVRSRGEVREVEFIAQKGARGVIVQGVWAIGPPLNEAGIKQFQQLLRATLDKLP